MQQIAEWLEKLGLEQYAKLFAENDIDIAILPHLSDQDLKDLGVSLGHRRKIFAAINKGIASVQPLAEAERPKELTTASNSSSSISSSVAATASVPLSSPW